MEDQRPQGPMDCDCMDMENCPHYSRDPRRADLAKHDIIVGDPEAVTIPKKIGLSGRTVASIDPEWLVYLEESHGRKYDPSEQI